LALSWYPITNIFGLKIQKEVDFEWYLKPFEFRTNFPLCVRKTQQKTKINANNGKAEKRTWRRLSLSF